MHPADVNLLLDDGHVHLDATRSVHPASVINLVHLDATRSVHPASVFDHGHRAATRLVHPASVNGLVHPDDIITINNRIDGQLLRYKQVQT